MTELNFILDLQQQTKYPYWEEINEGILKNLPSTQQEFSILDVGAGRGVLAEALTKLGYEVYALEANELIANEALPKVKQVICADLQELVKIRQLLAGKKFSYIIFSDVLEHVYDPLNILRSYQEFLEKGGKILLSLPNTVNWLNRIRFLFGTFNYELTGVMDRTHIRFFTIYSAKKLVKASACKLEKVDYTPFLTRAFLPLIKRMLQHKNTVMPNLSNSNYFNFYRKFLYPMEYWLSRLMPGLFAFRIILIASKQE